MKITQAARDLDEALFNLHGNEQRREVIEKAFQEIRKEAARIVVEEDGWIEVYATSMYGLGEDRLLLQETLLNIARAITGEEP